MAHEWIKMETNLADKPEVKRLAKALGIDKFAVVGRLHALWSYFDHHGVDGFVDVLPEDVDADVVGLENFCASTVDVGWLEITSTGLRIPGHEKHNGNGAKTRNLKSERQARWRENKKKKKEEECRRHVDAPVDVSPPTREEKRREEKEKPDSSYKPQAKARNPDRNLTSSLSPERPPDWVLTKTPLLEVMLKDPKWAEHHEAVYAELERRGAPNGSMSPIREIAHRRSQAP